MSLLSANEQQQVADAIAQVERDSDAELVTVLAAQADDYRDVALLWASLLALLLPGAINYYPAWLDSGQLLLGNGRALSAWPCSSVARASAPAWYRGRCATGGPATWRGGSSSNTTCTTRRAKPAC